MEDRNIYPISQNQSDSTKDSFSQNFSKQPSIPAYASNNVGPSEKKILNNENTSSTNKIKQSLNLQNEANRTNTNINLNMKSKDVISEINQSKKTKNQMEFQRKVYNTYYNIQKPSNSFNNRVPIEYANLNSPDRSMSFNQNQLLDLVFHYQNIINNMNNNMSFIKNELNLTKQSLTFTQQKLNSTQLQLDFTQQELNSTKQELNSKNQELDIKINNIYSDIKQMNKLYKKDISEIKSNFIIMNEKLNLSGKNENVCLNSIKKILNVLDNILDNTKNINQYLNEENDKKSQEIILLKKEVELLKSRVMELQEYLIGRKLIKLLLKKILEKCFDSFSFTIDENKTYKIQKAKLTNNKYTRMINVVNKILKALHETNKIIHIEDNIHKIIDIINSKTTYGDISKICKDLLPKNKIDLINEVLKENQLYFQACGNELIGKDKELLKLLE
jgi:hypothetical protein